MTGPENTATLKAYFRRIFDSPVSRRLLSIFAVITLIQVSFIAILAYQTSVLQDLAERELKVLELAQKSSEIAKQISYAWKSGFDMMDEDSQGAMEEYTKRFNAVLKMVDAYAVDARAQGIQLNDTIVKLKYLMQRTDSLGRSIVARRPRYNRRELLAFTSVSTKMYEQCLVILHDLQAQTPESSKVVPLGISPLQLLYASVVINLLLLAALAIYLEKRVSSPISAMIESCSYLEKAEVIPGTLSAGKELEVLEKSLREMSLALAENERGKKTYIAVLKRLQSDCLNNVREQITELRAQAEPGSKQMRMYDTAARSLSRLLNLLGSISTDMSLSAHEIKPDLRAVSCKKLIDEACSSVESLIEEKKLLLKTELPPDLILELDEVLMGRVLTNLLSNAIKYSPEQETIELTVSSEGSHVKFELADHGPGISKENLPKLFKKFSQTEAADGIKRSGTGLGLASCKQIVEVHNGDIGCISELGKGSSFWISLPISRDNLQAPEREFVIERGPASRNALPWSIKRILVFTLGFYLVVQFIMMFALQDQLKESAYRSEQFSLQRNILYTTEDLIGNYTLWCRAADRAYLLRDYNEQKEGNEYLYLARDEIREVKNLISARKSATYARAESIEQALNKLIKLSSFDKSQIDSLSMMGLMKLLKRQGHIVNDLDRDSILFLDLLKADVDSAYEWSQQMKADLVQNLALSALFNVLLILFVVTRCLSITGRISSLCEKASDFAEGKPLIPEFKCKDELLVLELRLFQTSKAIQQANQERQELMAVVNHDLRTPVASIVNGLELARAGAYGQLPSWQAEILASMRTALTGLVSQVNSLLLIEKIDAGQLSPEFSRFLIGELWQAVIANEELHDRLKAKSIELELVSEPGADAEIYADRELIEFLLRSLLDNAVTASAQNSKIQISITKESEKIVFLIQNGGEPIKEELQRQVFERFRFLDGKPLTGLGLPLVSRICKLHKAEINLDSSAANGTSVTVIFPRTHSFTIA